MGSYDCSMILVEKQKVVVMAQSVNPRHAAVSDDRSANCDSRATAVDLRELKVKEEPVLAKTL